MASTMDKVKHALHLDKNSNTTTTGHSTTSGTSEGVAGPHNSRVANAADPRVDSDLDNSRNAGAASHNAGLTGTGAGYSSTNTGSTTTAGPHSSNLANKVDPRVDSDRSNQYGTTGTGVGTGVTHTSVGHSTTTTTGPHSSNLANKIDPRVDSDRSNQYGTTGINGGNNNYGGTSGSTFGNTGTHGGISNSTNAGPHDSNLANKIDPRVDSDLSGSGNNHGASTRGGVFGSSGTHATPGSGTAQNTAGPHNSDTMNKLDPRVDADLDGSKTYGGNRTHS